MVLKPSVCVAQAFFDSIAVRGEDAVGGLTFEEFWEALVRIAVTCYEPEQVLSFAAMMPTK
jgi:hypothetical protein